MQDIIKDKVNYILGIQRHAWKNGHENYGSELDVIADMVYYLKYFDHLNPKQRKVLKYLTDNYENLQYAQKLCSKAHKSVRHFIVMLK